MKKSILSVLVALMVAVTSFGAPMSAFAAEVSTQSPEEVSPLTTYIINEGDYLTSGGNYRSYGWSAAYINREFTIIVNFKTQNSTGSATLVIGDVFSREIPCDGVSRAYTIKTTFYDGPVMWEILNHPANMAYSVRMYLT